jgi:tetratricopeptide (TPR) repeat protein
MSLVEDWDLSGQFRDAEHSAARFREFLRTQSDIDDESAALESVLLLGESFAEAGRAAEALIAGEQLERLFDRLQSAEGRQRLVDGLLTIGGALLNGGLRRDAIHVFETTERLLAGSKDPALDRVLAVSMSERGFALKEEAYAASAESTMQEAISTFRELERRFGSERDAPFPELVAIAAYNRAGALGAMGRVEEAARSLAQLSARYADSADAALREVAMFSEVRERMMLAIPDAPSYVSADELAHVYQDTDDPEGARERLEARVSAALESHGQAASILQTHRMNALPFALFLRTFDREAFAVTTASDWLPESYGPQVINFDSLHEGRLEQETARALEERPAVAIANRASLSERAWIIPRLFLSDGGWQEVAEALIRTAHLIVLGIEAMTPGVKWELRCIERSGRTQSTIVVLLSTGENDFNLRAALRSLGESSRTVPLATSETAELAAFECVVGEDELPAVGLAALPALAGLLEDMDTTSKLGVEGRVRRLAGL